MSRRFYIMFFLFLLVACSSYQGRSPLESAKLAYVDGALAYNIACDAVLDLREQGKLSDAQWRLFKQAQSRVRTTAPIVRAAIDLWEETGVEPATLSADFAALSKAYAAIDQIRTEAQP